VALPPRPRRPARGTRDRGSTPPGSRRSGHACDVERAIAQAERHPQAVVGRAQPQPEHAVAELVVVVERDQVTAGELIAELEERLEIGGHRHRALARAAGALVILRDRRGRAAGPEQPRREPAGRQRVVADEVGRLGDRPGKPDRHRARRIDVHRVVGDRHAAERAVGPRLGRAAGVIHGVEELARHGLLGAVVVAVLLQREPRAAHRGEQVGRVAVVAASPGAREPRRAAEQRDLPAPGHGTYSTPIDGKIGNPLV
jgi:hypothetical protein